MESIQTGVSASRREQTASLVPLLASGEELVSSVRELVTGRLGQGHRDWLHQGAARVAEDLQGEWGQVEGHTLQQTANLVRVAIAKTRQSKF